MTIDRRYSVAEGTAIKAPCRVATTANITLGGLQTVDGVTVAEHDRILVKDQADQTLNGIYEASTGNWQRTKDFDGARDIVQGTRVDVVLGTVGGSRTFAVATADPIVIGTSNITFTSPNVLAGPPGISGGTTQIFATRTQAIGTAIDTGLTRITIDRYAAGHPVVPAIYITGTSAGPLAFRDNGGIGNWWELDISSGVLDAAWFGVSGDGSNQTTQLQAAIDAVPATSGALFVGGDVLFTTLNLKGRYLIRLIGKGGWGAGADQATTLHTSVGAGVERAIDARDTIGITFERMKVAGTNAAHDGYLIDFGQSTLSSFSQTMGLQDCVILYNGTLAAVNLYGALLGSYERTLFGGAGTSIAFQILARVDQLIFSNVHNFRSCNFNPSGTARPVLGSGEQISFDGCNVQASSTDGQGRFWNTSLFVPFIAASIFNCAFYDATTAGNTWGNFFAGNGLNIIGNRVAGAGVSPSNYGFALGSALNGVKGFTVLGNDAQFITALLGFNGSAGAGTNATGGVVGGNTVRGSTSLLYSGLGAADAKLTNLGNYIAAGGQGENFFISGLPTGPANAGDWYSNAGVVTVG